MENERFKIVFAKLVQEIEGGEVIVLEPLEIPNDELEEIAELSRLVQDVTAPSEDTYTTT